MGGEHFNARLHRGSEKRPTESKVTDMAQVKAADTRAERRRGRPKGSKNKPRALIDKQVASELLGVVKEILPQEYYNDMRDAIRSGKNISTVNEAKILLKLMGPPLWQRLINEVRQKSELENIDPELAQEIGSLEVAESSKETNERIKIMISLMQLVARLEENEQGTDNTEKPIVEVYARRGLDSDRIAVLIGRQSDSVGGSVNGTGRPDSDTRTIPDKLPERSFDLQNMQQGEADRIFDGHSTRSSTSSDGQGQL